MTSSEKTFKNQLIEHRQFLAKFFSENHLPSNLIHRATPSQIHMLTQFINLICEKKIPIRPTAFKELTSAQLDLLSNFNSRAEVKKQLIDLAPSLKHLLRPVFFRKPE